MMSAKIIKGEKATKKGRGSGLIRWIMEEIARAPVMV